VAVGDLNGDGYPDVVACHLGLNRDGQPDILAAT